ncbi:hypothetical protein T440DRAFT_466670 [Plenodomus tracheiphilus IPT5]|uniref:Extracellular membrane protein CFEM domain-containing protein n=1 Tax=Plenodomus tracheiphilus IPT5 TaxID=1408161 RepID=A0A6A7BEB7_9PLEO|nr:hypothetical protein T440DRAFT_466670 [Plenodomus tracheiphilus IPT5]
MWVPSSAVAILGSLALCCKGQQHEGHDTFHMARTQACDGVRCGYDEQLCCAVGTRCSVDQNFQAICAVSAVSSTVLLTTDSSSPSPTLVSRSNNVPSSIATSMSLNGSPTTAIVQTSSTSTSVSSTSVSLGTSTTSSSASSAISVPTNDPSQDPNVPSSTGLSTDFKEKKDLKVVLGVAAIAIVIFSF